MQNRCSEIRRWRVKLPYGSEIMLRIVKLHFVQLRCDKVTLDRRCVIESLHHHSVVPLPLGKGGFAAPYKDCA